MKRISIATFGGIIIGILAIAPSRATSATIVQTQGFTGLPSVRKTVEFDRFNPARGDLISAEWQLILEIEGGESTIDNDIDSSSVVDVYLGAIGSLSSVDVSLLDAQQKPILRGDSAVLTQLHSRFELAADDGDGPAFSATGPDAATLAGRPASSSGIGTVDPKQLTNYVGTEMFALSVDIDPILELSPSIGLAEQVTPVTVWPNVVLIYDYDPISVPEPAGVCILVCGVPVILGVGSMFRRGI